MQGAGRATNLFRVPRPVNIISLDFWQFNVKLFSSAQLWTCVISLVAVFELSAGIVMYVSSANLIITLPTWVGWRADAMTTNEAGPNPEPCITLAWMSAYYGIWCSVNGP